MSNLQRTPPKKNYTATSSTNAASKDICFICNTLITITRNIRTLKCCKCLKCAHLSCLNINNSEFNSIDKNTYECIECSKQLNKQSLNFTEMSELAENLCQKDDPSNRDIILLMSGILKSQEFISLQFDSFRETIQLLREDNTTLKHRVNNLESKVTSLETEINKIQQASLKNHIVVTGLPIKPIDETNKIVEKIGNILSI